MIEEWAAQMKEKELGQSTVLQAPRYRVVSLPELEVEVGDVESFPTRLLFDRSGTLVARGQHDLDAEAVRSLFREGP